MGFSFQTVTITWLVERKGATIGCDLLRKVLLPLDQALVLSHV